jgi:hypothetical protein
MSWKFVTKNSGCAVMYSWLQGKKVGTTTDIHTCESCGYIGNLDIVHYRVWAGLVPLIPISNFDRGVCPKCGVSQEILGAIGK